MIVIRKEDVVGIFDVYFVTFEWEIALVGVVACGMIEREKKKNDVQDRSLLLIRIFLFILLSTTTTPRFLTSSRDDDVDHQGEY